MFIIILLPKNIILIIALINRIFIYSAKNSNVNSIDEYSTLNPETSSDSLSVRSNGVRLVSASLLIVSNINAGNKGKKYHVYCCASVIILRFSLLDKYIVLNMIKPIAISYLIICAVARIDPNNLYLEFLDQPVNKIVYILSEESASIIIMPILVSL